ncbi:flagellar basal-body rod protein FlgG [Pseudobacteroides cellulosolvens]|uniref:Flagellar basal-body rod protein FlgG n=1 Tax=Pseudobacteroides cellulosolvens ATCC 35603 = DSM 2933 TaxID=398512 RepID=A0A0L6JNJ3_9FIRM|nr:flagellar basal-body rod protein FlgG [Pseudobacteroides cellulosolvens]KNY27329.1 flagellar basal-body rod protein FlgG [Pseudobacteroides cellulosolvens ATCC 35603 = DSM 2933]
MMRALWTAGGGMQAQQFNVDVISNNLANVNTTGYKKERAEFKDLLYETVNRAYMLEGTGKPVNLQVGHGAAPVATVKNFSSGNLEKTENALDFAINGDAFFTIRSATGEAVFTRDGSFKLSVTDQGNMLTTSDGLQVLDDAGNPIILNIDTAKLNVTSSGELTYIDENGATASLGQKIAMVKFPNKQGLESIGNNLFRQNSASGAPVLDEELAERSSLQQGYLESSNVQVVEEMVKLIVAQRAYEINSKAIQSADEMLGLANNLRK